MPEKIKEILDKILAWWNKFTAKQKTAIICGTAAVVFTFAILIIVFTKPQYVQFQQCSNTSEAAEIISILDDSAIEHEESSDGLSIKVKSEQLGSANLALGAAGYVPDDYSFEDAMSGGLGTTASDREKQWVYFLQKKLEGDIETFEAVKSAIVNLNIPDQTGTLIATDEEASAWVQLTLKDTFSAEQAATVARAIATALGNRSTANITIVDSYANLLFSGEEDYSTAGVASSMLELRAQAETMVGADVKKVLVGSKQFDMVEVACRLEIDFAEYQRTIHEYYANNGRDEGMYSHYESYEDSNTSGVSGVPGTDSNDENTYQFENGTDTESESNQLLIDYLPNELISVENLPAGIIDFGDSSLALTAITYRIVKEEVAKEQGLLDGISWEEYKAANDTYTKMEVDSDFYSIVANATGIPEDQITILAYEVPQFIDEEGVTEEDITLVVSIFLMVVILALLAFVIIKSMATKKEVAEEEELSVESLLQSMPEQDVEDIEIETKSETRKLIEKFVDDNPEAAANLLRNWLNEDWN